MQRYYDTGYNLRHNAGGINGGEIFSDQEQLKKRRYY